MNSKERFNIITPGKTLSMMLQSNEHTTWQIEYLVKEKSDIDIISKYMTYPLCDVQVINNAADEFVAPYDSELIEAAHHAGQRIAYHTCGGMMPILEYEFEHHH